MAEWKSGGWVVLGLWWAVCFAGPTLFRHGLPVFLALLLIRSKPPPVVTEALLQKAIADLAVLAAAFPTLPQLSLPPSALLRAAALLTVPWLILTYVVRTQILLAIIGSLVLVHRAPWARLIYALLQKSAFLRSPGLALRAFLTGVPSPPYSVSNQPTPSTPAPVPSLRFLFTVYENQRWWVGLDWTAALLPSERPSWSSSTLHPVSPPAVFSLPDPSTVYLPSSNSRLKRTAIWRWDEPEWRLLVHKDGTSLSRIESSPSPTIDDPTPPTTAQSSSSTIPTTGTTRLFKAAANKFKDVSSSTSTSTSTSHGGSSPPPSDSSFVIDHSPSQDDSTEPLTDPDGWIYADNKWENQSHRGGLGKYTRYRRWTRVAVVTESVEILSPGSTGVQIKSNDHVPSSSSPSSSPTKTINKLKLNLSDPSRSPELSSISAIGTSTPTPSSSASMININDNNTPEPESPLRQRLRAALSKSSSSSSSISVP